MKDKKYFDIFIAVCKVKEYAINNYTYNRDELNSYIEKAKLPWENFVETDFWAKWLEKEKVIIENCSYIEKGWIDCATDYFNRFNIYADYFYRVNKIRDIKGKIKTFKGV